MTFFNNFIWIAWLVFIIVRAVQDSHEYLEWKEAVRRDSLALLVPRINHARNVLRALLWGVMMYIFANIYDFFHLHFDWWKIWFYAIGCAASYWLIFDILFNILAEMPSIWYNGDESKIDKLEKKLPITVQGMIFFKCLLTFMGIYMYYNVPLLWAF